MNRAFGTIRAALLVCVTVVCGSGLGLGVLAVGPLQAETPPRITGADAPSYAPDGSLIRPDKTEHWVFAGSSLGIQYHGTNIKGTERFHNVLISPPAFEAYKATGRFPDGTMLLLDIYAQEGRTLENPFLTDGTFNGANTGFEIAVKNPDRPDRRDDSSAVWAYYSFGNRNELKATARAFKDSACEQCHAKHAADDHVFVQFYPTLRQYRKN